jgi:hypothetical protein
MPLRTCLPPDLKGSTRGIVCTRADLDAVITTGTLLAPCHVTVDVNALVFFLISDCNNKLKGKVAWLLNTKARHVRSEPVTVNTKKLLKLYFDQVQPITERLVPVTLHGRAVSIGVVSRGPLIFSQATTIPGADGPLFYQNSNSSNQ